MLQVSASRLRAEFKTVEFVSRPGARASTAAVFELEDRHRGLARLDRAGPVT
jgi:hypothetical protein